MSANTEGLKKSYFLPVSIILILAIGIYLNTLKNGFVYVYDDEVTIVNNTLINRLDNLPFLFNKTAYFSRSGEISYRPVVTLTYFIDYALYGLRPWGYHLTNVLLHAINGALLYILLTLIRRQAGDSPLSHSSLLTSPPFLISLLFVSHPVLTDAVNCISYREDLLAFLFYMTALSLHLILRQPTPDPRPLTTSFLFLLSCLTYLLALFSKEMAVTLPLTIICYEWLYSMEKTKLPSRLFDRYIIGYITITISYLYLRFYLLHNPNEHIEAWGVVERVLTLPWLIMGYLKLSLFPIQLSADYVINPVSSPFSPIFILPIIALISIFAIILLHPPLAPLPSMEGKQTVPSPLAGEGRGEGVLGQRSILFGALFFLITLIPVYNLVPLPNPFAERYLYLPVAGFTMFAVLLTYLIAKKLKARSEHGNRYVPIFFFVLIIFSFFTVKRSIVWKDDYSLWSDTVVKMSNSSRAHNNLGITYGRQGLFDQAIKEFITALKLKPDYPEAYNNLGLAYHYQGRIDEAIGEFLKALRLRVDYAEAHNNLGLAYFKQGRYDAAIYELKTALRFRPDFVIAHNNLGNTYLRQGLLDQAIKEFLIAVRLKPDDAEAHNDLGVIYLDQGRYDEAMYEFSIALKLKPDFKEVYRNLEVAYERKKGKSISILDEKPVIDKSID